MAKTVNSINPAIKELERCFDIFNKALYAGKLPRPMMTIQAAKKVQAYGWFCPGAWSGKKTDIHEINLSAEWLKRDVVETMQTLIHEMVHLDNNMNEINDCNPANQYHNKKFKIGCEKIGLECEKFGRFGWAKTSLSKPLIDLVKKAKPNAEAFKIFRKAYQGKTSKPGSKLKKWTCECGVNVRVAIEDFDATCNQCESQFQLAE